MKACYCDESGTGAEPIAVMVGVIIDAQRMHVTKNNWKELLIALSRIVGKPIEEFHTRDFYSGNGCWRELSGNQRSSIISIIFDWLKLRRHDVVYVSVEKAKFYESQKAGQLPPEVNSLWRLMGLHLLLCVQKLHQNLGKTRGHTFFVFDNEERERMRFTDLIANPPAWTDSYYAKGKKQSRLDQIVDVPYFGDSREVRLLQLADFLAFFLRRHVEIAGGYTEERYEQEGSKLAGWLKTLQECSIPARVVYPATGRCECSNLFFQHAPEIIRKLGRD
jgi:hypothetical protein